MRSQLGVGTDHIHGPFFGIHAAIGVSKQLANDRKSS